MKMGVICQRPDSCDAYANQRPSGEKAGSKFLNSVSTNATVWPFWSRASVAIFGGEPGTNSSTTICPSRDQDWGS